MESVLYSDKT